MNDKTTNKTSRISNRTSSSVSRTSNRVTPKKHPVSNPLNQRERESFNYQATKIRVRDKRYTFPTASQAAVFMLQNTQFSQSAIARRVGVSQPCVCQLARTLK